MSSSNLNRRKFIGGAVTATIAAAGLTGAAVVAQPDATPDPLATPGTPDSQATPGASPVGATPAAGGGEVTVELIDIAFEPREITITANTDVPFVFNNTSLLPHDFVIDELEVASEMLFAGESQTLTINAAAGTYEFYCSVIGHVEAGMVGTLTVQ